MEIVMSGIAKAFGTNQVLRDVSITLKEGEVHALMGENGAGKSTLINLACLIKRRCSLKRKIHAAN